MASQQNKPLTSFTAWHVGRVGEVAGGMTQVINSYRNWTFQHCQVRVLESRDGSKGLRAIALFLRALLGCMRLGSTRQNMVIVHLSQRGAFVREGLVLLAAKLRGYGVIAHLHGSQFVQFSRQHPRLVGAILRRADRVIVLSDATREAVERFVPADRVVLVQNAVLPGRPGSKQNRVVFGGAVSHRKGVDVLMAAWKKVGQDTGWRLLVAGPIQDEAVVDRSLAAVEFLGSVPHETLMSLLDASKVAVLPSRDEAMPMFILEALARDNCVISTRVGGIPAVLGAGCGILVDAGNVDQLSAELKSVIEDESRRTLVAQAGRRKFEEAYSAAAVYGQLERTWASVLPA